MITRLTLTNFMAHAATVLDLSPGLCVLTGPNNSGKSAVVEALRCLTRNPPPRHVIRHGAAEARVELTLEDGTRVAWVRRPKYALYELTRPGAAEPEVFAKFGRTPPEAILDALRLDLVPLEVGEPVDVHIGNQREPVFLLNQPGTAVAGFFAASSEAAHLVAMQNRLTDRVRKAKTESRRLETRLGTIAAELDRLAPLPELEYRLSAADALEDALAGLGRAIPALDRLLAADRTIRDRLAALGRTREVLGRLDGPPVLAPTAPLAACLERRQGLALALARLAGRRAVLDGLGRPPELDDTAALARQAAILARAVRSGRRQEARAKVLSRLAPPPILADTAVLAALCRRLDAARNATRSLTASLAALAGLAEPPAIADTRPLAELGEAIASVRTAIAAKEAALDAKTRALATAGERIEARLAAIGACPLCGGALTAADFLGHGHPHRNPDEAS